MTPQATGLYAMETWAGIEATVNRVGGRYYNQLVWSGHLDRPDDIDRFACLGISAIRYPVIWEMLEPAEGEAINWQFVDQQMGKLREKGIRAIVGLVHHGSGPRHASIESPRFAVGLERFARRVAERFPWIDSYTPVNEPLTTARFCGLYGLWYPHGGSHRAFARILLNECRGTILAMRAIREVNPSAGLIQTDDLGRIYGTDGLCKEIEYQNDRRWLAWDLICGLVDRNHALWRYLRTSGVSEDELRWFLDNGCPPDVIGVNHYPTSDRFLDENVDLYGAVAPCEGGAMRYVDTEAVRVLPEAVAGFEERLLEAWRRYRIPVAITESHLGCTREEQMRWFADSWTAAVAARENGAEVRAVTAWSLLGAFNWNSLVTRDEGYYEPGVFDVRGVEPRETGIASVLRAVAAGQMPRHPALEQPGWWRRPERLFEAHRALATRGGDRLPGKVAVPCSQLLILGATGTLGRAFVAACEIRGLAYIACSRQEADLRNPGAVRDVLRAVRPWAVINATGYVRVDEAEIDQEGCFEVNTEGAVRLAAACEHFGAPVLCFSSDLVFDGKQWSAYVESDAPGPLNIYGRSKVEMERRVSAEAPKALIARTSAFFGPADNWNFVTHSLNTLRNGESLRVPEDVIVSPTYVPHLVSAALDLLIDGASGIWHLANEGEISWAGFARLAARRCGVSEAGIVGCSSEELNLCAERPIFSALISERGRVMPSLERAICDYSEAVIRGSSDGSSQPRPGLR